jgi:hypothetical protein
MWIGLLHHGRKMKYLSKITLLVLLFSLTVVAHAGPTTVTIGSEQIQIPNVSSFTNVRYEANKNVLPDSYAPGSDVLKVFSINRRFNKDNRFIIISTPKELKNRQFNSSDFTTVASGFKSVYKDITSEPRKKDTVIFFEILNRTDATGHINVFTTMLGAKEVNANVIMLVRGRLLLLDMYTKFDSMSDIDWLEKEARLWSSKIINANKGYY